MKANVTIDEALLNPKLLGAALGDPKPWQMARTVLKAGFGIALNRDEARAFASVASSRKPPNKRVRELWMIVGRRGGKSRMAAAIACYVALFVKHKLAPGEVGTVLVLSASLDQSKIVFNYALAFLQQSPVLCKEITNITQDEITLRNGIVIAVHANSFRSVRGRTLLAVIFDELAFWRDDTSATPDHEVYTAVLPSLATCNGLLVGISSPYRKVGLLYQKHKQYYGIDSNEVLVVQGSSQTFNPTLTAATIAEQKLADPTAADSEWDANFRPDLVGLYGDAVIDSVVDHGRPLELPPRPTMFYRAFTDPSGGAIGGDTYSFAIAHREDDRFVVDLVRGRQGPFDTKAVTEEYAELCHQYNHIGAVVGDLYSHQWVQGAWRACGVDYVVSDLNASMIYLETLPLFTRGLVRLPDHPALLRELRLLERIPGRVGKDQVTHPRHGHDDYANAVCGCLRVLSNYLGYDLSLSGFSDGPGEGHCRTALVEALKSYAMLNQRPW